MGEWADIVKSRKRCFLQGVNRKVNEEKVMIAIIGNILHDKDKVDDDMRLNCFTRHFAKV